MLEFTLAVFNAIFSITFGVVFVHAAYCLIRHGSYALTLGGQEVFCLGPSRAPQLLTEGDDAIEDEVEEPDENDEEEEDERSLVERLEGLGIDLIEARTAPEIGDIGGVFFDTETDEDDCPSCQNDALHAFGEVIGVETADREDKPGRAARNRYGSACDSCGHLQITETFERRGRFGPLMSDRVELDLFEVLEGFEAKAAALAEDDAALAEQEQELEGKLNGIRIRRQSHALAVGTIEPFRGTPGVAQPDVPAERVSDSPMAVGDKQP